MNTQLFLALTNRSSSPQNTTNTRQKDETPLLPAMNYCKKLPKQSKAFMDSLVGSTILTTYLLISQVVNKLEMVKKETEENTQTKCNLVK